MGDCSQLCADILVLHPSFFFHQYFFSYGDEIRVVVFLPLLAGVSAPIVALVLLLYSLLLNFCPKVIS